MAVLLVDSLCQNLLGRKDWELAQALGKLNRDAVSDF